MPRSCENGAGGRHLPTSPAEVRFEIDPQEVLRLQGYRRPSDVPTPEVLEILRAGMAEARHVLRPRLLYREFVVDSVDSDGCRLQGGHQLLLREIPERWGAIARMGLAVVTIGEALEGRIDALFAEREFPLALMLDSLGSVAAEALAEGLHRRLCADRLAQGLTVTSRESPGYSHWPIEEQRTVFALLPATPIGVELNPYCVMMPRKSISFAVGIGPEAKAGSSLSPCRSCDMGGCAYRRAPRPGLAPPWVSTLQPLFLDSTLE